MWVKVLRVFESENKIKMSLSMKECNQQTGKDLNPSNNHDEGYFADNQYIQSSSIRKITCSRCGLQGHAEWECYTDLNNKELYTLLSDGDDEKKEDKKSEEPNQHQHRHRHHHHHRHHSHK